MFRTTGASLDQYSLIQACQKWPPQEAGKVFKKKNNKTHDLPQKNRARQFMNNFYASDAKLQILSYCTVRGTKHLRQLFLGGVSA